MRSLKIALLFTITLSLMSCSEIGLKSFTDNPDRLEPVGDNNDLLDKKYVTFDKNGDTLKVADSGWRKINGVDTRVATSAPRIQKHTAPDSSMRIWPNYATVKGWLTLENYYDWKLPLGILCWVLIPVIWFGFGKHFEKAKKMAGWALFAVAVPLFYGAYEFAAEQPRVMAENNSKVIPIDEYRKQKAKDNFVSFWDSLRVNNRIIKE